MDPPGVHPGGFAPWSSGVERGWTASVDDKDQHRRHELIEGFRELRIQRPKITDT